MVGTIKGCGGQFLLAICCSPIGLMSHWAYLIYIAFSLFLCILASTRVLDLFYVRNGMLLSTKGRTESDV